MDNDNADTDANTFFERNMLINRSYIKLNIYYQLYMVLGVLHSITPKQFTRTCLL